MSSERKTFSAVQVPGCLLLALVFLSVPGLIVLLFAWAFSGGSNPGFTGSPSSGGRYTDAATSNPQPLPATLCVQNRWAHVSLGTNLYLYDLANPTTATLVTTIKLSANAVAAETSGSLVYAALDSDQLEIVDFTVSNVPTVLGRYSARADLAGLALAGHFAFLKSTATLQLIEVNDPTSPTKISDFPILYPASDAFALGNAQLAAAHCMSVAGPYVYLTSANLEVIDVSDPAAPKRVGSYYSPSNFFPPFFVQVIGSRAVVANVVPVIFSLESPAAPRPVGVYLPDQMISSLTASPALLLATTGTDLEIIDLRDPTRPVLASIWKTVGYSQAAAIRNSKAYVVTSEPALLALDLADPAKPREIFTCRLRY